MALLYLFVAVLNAIAAAFSFSSGHTILGSIWLACTIINFFLAIVRSRPEA